MMPVAAMGAWRLRTVCLSMAICLTGSPVALLAQDTGLVDGHGTTYTSTNDSGTIVLKSATLTIRLKPACGASSPQLGNGTWGWANGGVLVTFPSRTIGFPRQEIAVDDGHDCRL